MESPTVKTTSLHRPRQPLVWVISAVSLGMALDRYGDPPPLIWFGGAAMVGALWGLLFATKRFQAAAFALLAGVCAWGGAWHHVYWNAYASDEVSLWAESQSRPVALEGSVSGSLRQSAMPREVPMSFRDRNPRTFFDLKATRIRLAEKWETCSGTVRVMVSDEVDLIAGDRIRIWGSLRSVQGTRNPGEFDFQAHYRGQRILAWAYVDRFDAINVVGKETLSWRVWRSALRHHFDRAIGRSIASQRAPLASAILLGNREQLSTDDRDDFMLTGTVHILAISGLHVGILSGALFWVLRLVGVSRRSNLFVAILFVVFYAWLVEFRPPVTRAMILIVCYCVSRLLGRTGFSFNLLATSAVVVLCFNPTDLFGLGPQLSFLAVFAMSGVIMRRDEAMDPVKKLVLTTRSWPVLWGRALLKRFWKGCWASALIWVVTMPLVAYQFHLVVPIGLLINPFVLLPMSLALFGGLLVMACGGWLEPIATLGGRLTDASLAIIQWLVDLGSRVEGGHIWTAGPSLASVLVFYGGLLAVRGRPAWHGRSGPMACLLLFWIGAFWLGPAAWDRYHRDTSGESWTMTSIDVGHGTSVLMKLPHGKNLLFDAGSFGSVEGGARSIAGVLWSEQVMRIDALFISHADVDHFNAVPKLCEQFVIGEVFVPRHIRDSHEASVARLRDVLGSHGIPLRVISRGMRLDLGNGNYASVWGPSAYPLPGSDNSNSIVLHVEALGRSVLLPGDLEPPGLETVLSMPARQVDVALAPHHGSLGSQPRRFVSWCNPSIVLISGSHAKANSREWAAFQAPSSKVLSTGEEGAIRIQLSRQQVAWQTWITDRRRRGQRHFSDQWKFLSKGQMHGAVRQASR